MFQLDVKSRKSIYQQIIDNIKELIMRGVMPADSKLPSVRDLSRQLTVNPNTVQKAFRELERQGYIYTVTGRGSFVSGEEQAAPDPAKLREIREDIENAYRELRYLGMEHADARVFIEKTIGDLEETGPAHGRKERGI